MNTHTNTTPDRPDPTTLDQLLHALLDGDLTFPQVAARVSLSIADLAALLASPEVRKVLDALHEALAQRSRLLSATSESAALGALSTVMDELSKAETRREALEAEKAQAERRHHAPLTEALARSLAALENRDKQLAELSRSARATLTYARATRADTRHDLPQQTLRLAGGSE